MFRGGSMRLRLRVSESLNARTAWVGGDGTRCGLAASCVRATPAEDGCDASLIKRCCLAKWTGVHGYKTELHAFGDRPVLGRGHAKRAQQLGDSSGYHCG